MSRAETYEFNVLDFVLEILVLLNIFKIIRGRLWTKRSG